MRYTLTDRAIAILLSIILLIGSASAFMEAVVVENVSDETSSNTLNDSSDFSNLILTPSNDNKSEKVPDAFAFDTEDIITPNQDDFNGKSSSENIESPDFDGNSSSENIESPDFDGNSRSENIESPDFDGNSSSENIESPDFDNQKVDINLYTNNEEIIHSDRYIKIQSHTFDEIFPLDAANLILTFYVGSGSGDGTIAVGELETGATWELPEELLFSLNTPVTITAKPNTGSRVEKWTINIGGVVSTVYGGNSIDITMTNNITVFVDFELATSHLYFMSSNDSATIRATITGDTTPLVSGGSRSPGASITFSADPPVDDSFFVRWFAHEGTTLTEDPDLIGNGDSITYIMPPNDVLVERRLIAGHSVTFAVDGITSRGSLTALSNDTPFFGSPPAIENDTTVIFTATPNNTGLPGAPVYRVARWFVNGNLQTTGLSEDRTVFTLNITAATNVRVEFEEVTLNLSSPSVTITAPGSSYINAGLTGDVNGTILPTGSISFSGTNELEPKLMVSATGTTITINNVSLTSADNTDGTPHVITVTLDGVTKELEIYIDLPKLDILPPKSITITNTSPHSGSIILDTNVTDVITTSNLVFTPALPAGLDVSVSDILEFPNHYLITINGSRENPMSIINRDVSVSINGFPGFSDNFLLNVNLTPPPQITSITPTPATVSAFQNVRVHGTGALLEAPPSIPSLPVDAVFTVEGISFGSGNELEVEQSIRNATIPLLAALPTGITAGVIGVSVESGSSTRATVTIPLTIASNTSGAANGRDWTVTVATNLLNSASVTGTLFVTQAGPITLSPLAVPVTESNQYSPVEIAVTGSGTITHVRNDTTEGTFDANVNINYSASTDESKIEITTTRGAGDITGSFTVTFTRDGISEILTVTVDIRALDEPVVTWPTGFSATYGQLLSQVPTTGTLTNGSAVFGATPVPGIFVWTEPLTTPGVRVGNAGAPTHSMTFVPDNENIYARVTTGGPAPGQEHRTIVVAKANPSVTFPAGFNITYGQTLSQAIGSSGSTAGSAVFDGVTVNGTFTFDRSDASTFEPTVAQSGNPYFMTFTPTGVDAVNFNPVTVSNIPVVVIKADQIAPIAPTMAAHTPVSITLNLITGAEYGRSNSATTEPTSWQTDLIFTGLDPNTGYFFFARLQGDDNHNPSPASLAREILTEKATLIGTPVISPTGTIRYLDELSVDTSSLYADPPGLPTGSNASILGILSYRWIRNETTTIGTDSTYKLGPFDIGAKISVEVSSTNTEDPVLSAQTTLVAKRVPTLTNLIYNLTSTVFDGNPRPIDTPKAALGVEGLGTSFTVHYRPSGSTNESDWTITAPTNVGSYEVRATISEGDNYTEATIILTTSTNTYNITRIIPTADNLTATLNGSDIKAPGFTIPWSIAFLPPTNLPPTVIVGPASDVVGLGTITVFYSLNNGSPTTDKPTSTGLVEVTVNITQGVNYEAETGIDVGSFFITGTPFPVTDLTYEIFNVTENEPELVPFNIAEGFTNTFDGDTRQVRLLDSFLGESIISFSEDGGTTWSTDYPEFRNVTSKTIEFNVERPNTGWEPYTGSLTTVNITRASLSWSTSTNNTINNKVYDGNTNATVLVGPELLGIIGNDNVIVIPGTVSFNSANASIGIGITAADWGIGGANASNYTITGEPLFANANITPLQMTWSTNNTINNKIYDGNMVATILSAPTLAGRIGSDIVDVVQGTVSFSNANAATGISVEALGWSISGNSNYSAPAVQPVFAPANITPIILTWNTDGTVENKVYDGTNSATVDNEPTLSGFLDSDSVSIVEGNVTFNSANVASGIIINANGWDISGNTNYAAPLSQPVFATAEITRRQLTWNRGINSSNPATVWEKEFDGTTAATVLLTPTLDIAPSLTGVITSDTVTLTPAAVIFASSGVGLHSVTTTNWSIGGTSAGNYIAPATPPIFASERIIERQITGTVNIIVSDNPGPLGSIIDGTELTADIANIIGIPDPGGTKGSQVDLSFKWYVNNNLISGVENNVYRVDFNDGIDSDSFITVEVTGTNNYGGIIKSPPVAIGKIPLSGSISISGTLELYETLTLNTTALIPVNAEYSISWLRNGSVIGGETGTTYEIAKEDLGKTVMVVITGTGDFTGSLNASINIDPIIPEKPINLTASPGDTEVTLAWSTPFNGGSAITGYKISTSDDENTWIDTVIGVVTSHVVDNLTNGIEYTFRVYAINDEGEGPYEEEKATPVEQIDQPPDIPPYIPPDDTSPYIISITPTPETSTVFGNVPERGIVEQAVFDVTGVYLTEQALLGLNIFSIFEFPAWVLPSNLIIEYINSERAIITVTLTVFPNTDDARSGNVGIHNTITASTTGTLYVSQAAFEEIETFQVIILNTPNGETVIMGQSDSVREFEPGGMVSLVAGTRDGFEFNGWSTSSTGVVLEDVNSSGISFIMPENDVIIIANWTELEPEPPDDSPDGPPDEPPPDPISPNTDGNTNEDIGNTPEEGNGNGQGVESSIGSGEGSDPVDPSDPEPGGDPVIGGPSPPNNESKDSETGAGTGIGFGIWLMNNLWWIWLSIGAVTVGSTLSIMNYRKRKKKSAAIKAIDST